MKKDYLRMYQEGGAMPAAPAPEEAGAAPGGGGPEEMLMAVVQSQDPNLALEFCNMLAEQMGMGAGGGAAAPEAPAPAGPAPGGQPPMGRYGMKVPRIKL